MADSPADDLVRAAQGGDPDALDALLRRYQPQVYRFGVKMCGDPEAAQDVLQETLLAAARTLPGFRGESSVSTWLYAIARSFCIKARRRSASAPDLVSLESGAPEARAAPDKARLPDRVLADRELAGALDKAIASLAPEYREVLVLRDVEGLSAPEVAQVTGLGLAAVKSRLHRARATVRHELATLLPAPPPAPVPAEACPDVVAVLSRHLEGEIAAAACAEMESHVGRCPRCRAACDSLRRTLRLCGAIPAAPVPDAVQDSIRRGIRRVLAGPRSPSNS